MHKRKLGEISVSVVLAAVVFVAALVCAAPVAAVAPFHPDCGQNCFRIYGYVESVYSDSFFDLNWRAVVGLQSGDGAIRAVGDSECPGDRRRRDSARTLGRGRGADGGRGVYLLGWGQHREPADVHLPMAWRARVLVGF